MELMKLLSWGPPPSPRQTGKKRTRKERESEWGIRGEKAGEKWGEGGKRNIRSEVEW